MSYSHPCPVEPENVLASIRRLIEQDSQASHAGNPHPAGKPLLLTPSQSVAPLIATVVSARLNLAKAELLSRPPLHQDEAPQASAPRRCETTPPAASGSDRPIQDEANPASHLATASGDARPDGGVLRGLIRDVIRQELHGESDGGLNSNLRKLIRQEVETALQEAAPAPSASALNRKEKAGPTWDRPASEPVWLSRQSPASTRSCPTALDTRQRPDPARSGP